MDSIGINAGDQGPFVDLSRINGSHVKNQLKFEIGYLGHKECPMKIHWGRTTLLSLMF
jgi:hypothetical protein